MRFCEFLSNMGDPAPQCPECGAAMKNQGKRGKGIVSLLGEGVVSRNYFVCETPGCGCHAIPKDKALGIAGTSFSPGVRRVAAKLAACDSFESSSDTMSELCGVYVSSKDIERIAHAAGGDVESGKQAQIEKTLTSVDMPRPAAKMPIMYIEYDGTGVPVMKSETAGRQGKQEDGTAKTREAKLGCIFTQTALDKDGNPIRDKGSTTYFGAIETSGSFSRRLYMEAVDRDVASAEKVVVIGDGAKWIWNTADDNFPEAIQIVDLYHAKEHLWEFIRAVFPGADKQAEAKQDWYPLLDEGNIQKLTHEMSMFVPGDEKSEKDLLREVNYFKENAHRMKYADFIKQGLFVGSGVIEAGCKNVIGKRLKQSGMHWSVRGANAIIALRCELLSGKSRLVGKGSRVA